MITFDLDLVLREVTALYSSEQLFVLVDDNTRIHCFPEIAKTLHISPTHCLCIDSGETQKTLATVQQIWDFLFAQHANRHSLLLIVGGGVLTDIGGFAAATFMRGMPFVNICTTLLAAVDAGSGGKTGFNYQGLKNGIGTFTKPLRTIIYPPFLRTLSAREIRSGYAEMLKHALIASPLELARILAFPLEDFIHSLQKPTTEDEDTYTEFVELLSRSIEIKSYIVDQDPDERGIRKTLNFGHTIGHALEEYFLALEGQGQDEGVRTLLHGEAVAYGIVAELYLSFVRLGFSKDVLRSVTHYVFEAYGRIACPCKAYDTLIELMRHDKKAERSHSETDSLQKDVPQLNFTLLSSVGNYRINQLVTPLEVHEALDFLFNQ